MEQVSKFYEPSRDAAVYFEKISNYYSKCFRVAGLAKLGNALSPNESDEVKSLSQSAASITQELEDLLSSVIKKCAAIG